MPVLYRHINNYTGEPFYIGIGKTEKRAYQTIGRSKHWNSIVKKFGYSIDIILKDIPWNEACFWESFYIKLYGRIDLKNGILCNKTNGGDGVNGYVYTQEHIDKLKICKSGKNNPMFGRTHTKEVKEKLSKRFIGEKNARSKKVIDSETGIIYGSLRECSRETNISLTNIVYKIKVKNERFSYVSASIIK